MKDAYIYGLVDPRTGVTRYVGKSVNPRDRFKSHVHRCEKTDTFCARWIRTLRAIGLEPELVILEGPCKDWEEAESRWIAQLGPQLTNLTSGGDGLHDLVRTPEHCAKIGEANRRRVYTPEMRANISKAQKKRFADTDWLTEEVRAYRSAAAKSRKNTTMSAETRMKLATARTGTKASLETRAKMREARKNIPRVSCVLCRRVLCVYNFERHLNAIHRLGSVQKLNLPP